MIKRAFDIIAATTALALLSPVLVAVALAVKMTSAGPALYWSERFGRGSNLFAMPKFRSMRTDTPQLATHLIDGQSYLTPIGHFLRRSSLDELPQLWSVICGDMSLVGPRPALFNQDDLMNERRRAGVDVLRPGITGWAQVNGRDELTISQKVNFDREYLLRRSFIFDIRIILMTMDRTLSSRGIRH